jgi:potassium efflux system protein
MELAKAIIWPAYLFLLAYTARVAPWPRGVGILASAGCSVLAIAILAFDLVRWMARPSGWAERCFGVPRQVGRQFARAGNFLVVAALAFLFPAYLLNHNLIAPEGRPITAPAVGRILILGFELAAWSACVRLLRARSALLTWLAPTSSTGVTDPVLPEQPACPDVEPTPGIGALAATSTPSVSRMRASLEWLGRNRHFVGWALLLCMGSIIVLDVRGYSFTARRLAMGSSQTALVIALAFTFYQLVARAIRENLWRWSQPNRSWATRLTSAVALRAAARPRLTGSAIQSTPAPADTGDDAEQLEVLARGLRRVCAYALTGLALLAIAWVWELDLALLHFLLSQQLWSVGPQTPVTLGDVMQATVVLLLGALAWRSMHTLFAVTIFPRMPDDAGVRFAVLTLCRYAVLGLTSIIALGAIHLDLAKIGVVLAALGVGLGFGLQEIVSNFVCGIILLLERPIRIGDVVTVGGNTGKVDQINIRATMIINGDNQCMIVPNREFITGNLVNWTHQDRILRVGIKVGVAYGTDPDRVVELLLAVAREDADVLIDPPPGAALDGFGESALLFSLSVYVPDPGLAGKVRHRICAEIQRRFTHENIVIPLPTHELLVSRVPDEVTQALVANRDELSSSHRFDVSSATPPAPHSVAVAPRPAASISRVDGV